LFAAIAAMQVSAALVSIARRLGAGFSQLTLRLRVTRGLRHSADKVGVLGVTQNRRQVLGCVLAIDVETALAGAVLGVGRLGLALALRH
jgi:hypothetical protein